ncbi:MAG TPA: ABC transporter permease [Casimicrobiaceae bacterium]|nr:ABC transporter permease [Casimicrobiaceae bacterium]
MSIGTQNALPRQPRIATADTPGGSWFKPAARGALGVIVLLVAWEYFARSGMFSKAITPPLEVIFVTLVNLLADGTLIKHAAATMVRVFAGLAIALAVAVPLGMLMGRYPLWEWLLRPPLNVLMPIPSLAWVPLVVLWFGIGNVATVLVVVYASTFPLLYNVWTGVRTVNPLWIRAATVMNADSARLFRHIIWPAALPYVITGMRLSFGRAWIAVIGGELLASPEWGLGKVIFDAKEYLNADVMLAALFMIGVIGLFFERVVFQYVEKVTVNKWGMTRGKL